MKKKMTLLAALVVMLVFSAFTTERTITIFTIGDSTMANKPLEGDNQERGWGHVLGGFFTEDIVVDNHAVNGRSSKSFIDEGRWDAVLNKMKPGDYVFIQFGHNDEKADEKRHTDPGTTFDANLKRFVEETRAKGGIPVLFNSIVRRNFRVNENAVAEDDHRKDKLAEVQEGDVLVDTHGEYLNSPRNVARQLDVPFVDMNKLTHDLVQGMGPEASKKLYMWIPKGKYASCPKGRQDNTHLTIYGARTIARITVEAIAKEVPALAPYVRYYDYVVAKDGSGDFFTIQEAINAVPDFRKEKRTTILVRKGIYKEKLIVPESKLNVSLIGENGAVLTNDDYAQKKNCFGENMSTSGSSTCYIYGPDFYAENITFENTAGRVGQAVACFIEGDRAYFKNCRFLGNQDTLYNYGKDSRQYFENCYVEGTVDFIFGWSTVLFKDCTIHSVGDGYVTAPATDKGKKYGYVFVNCKLTAADEATKVYLSRPWRPYAQAVYIHCELGKHIVPQGWNNWGKKENEKTAFYAEYGNTGEGASIRERAPFGRQLKDLEGYDVEEILLGTDGWNPVKNGNELLKNIKR
ncbi:MAG: pectin esterase [Bacteroides sp.]|nr:pectin esterase [Bacteroides sp.]